MDQDEFERIQNIYFHFLIFFENLLRHTKHQNGKEIHHDDELSAERKVYENKFSFFNHLESWKIYCKWILKLLPAQTTTFQVQWKKICEFFATAARIFHFSLWPKWDWTYKKFNSFRAAHRNFYLFSFHFSSSKRINCAFNEWLMILMIHFPSQTLLTNSFYTNKKVYNLEHHLFSAFDVGRPAMMISARIHFRKRYEVFDHKFSASLLERCQIDTWNWTFKLSLLKTYVSPIKTVSHKNMS